MPVARQVSHHHKAIYGMVRVEVFNYYAPPLRVPLVRYLYALFYLVSSHYYNIPHKSPKVKRQCGTLGIKLFTIGRTMAVLRVSWHAACCPPAHKLLLKLTHRLLTTPHHAPCQTHTSHTHPRLDDVRVLGGGLGGHTPSGAFSYHSNPSYSLIA